MPFAAALSTLADSQEALHGLCSTIEKDLGSTVDLLMLFYSPHHIRAVAELAGILQEKFACPCVVGCPGETIVSNDQEVEEGPAMSLWAARWSRPMTLTPLHFYLEQTSEGLSLLGWKDAIYSANPTNSTVLLLADPFTFPVDVFLRTMNEEHKGIQVLGGMASGVRGAGNCRMILNGTQIDQGAVGVLLEGEIVVRPVVSQGCRPIGKPMVVTKARDNIIHELGGKIPLLQLQELMEILPPADQQLMRQGLHLGTVINEFQEEFHRGDFLVRNVMGLERDSGALILNERIRVGQTVQFHVRDAESADHDLTTLLQLDQNSHGNKPAGGLLFSCNGRGTRLFQEPSHDARAIRREVGDMPLAGFFAQGELGPVGGLNFIHGFTASVVLFEE